MLKRRRALDYNTLLPANFIGGKWYTLQEVLGNYENFVELIKKATIAMRECGFQPVQCAKILDDYYRPPITKSIPANEDNNYYYALTTPELRGIEIALEMLESPDRWNMDISKIRAKVDNLKLELWQLLPDFYKGHSDPMPQPLSYHQNKPYPHLCIAGIFEKEYLSRGLHGEYARIYPDTDSSDASYAISSFTGARTWKTNVLSTLTVNEGSSQYGPVLVGDSQEIDLSFIMDTALPPYADLLIFLEQIMVNVDPAYTGMDAEGPITHLLTAKGANRRENVRLLIYQEYENKSIRGAYNRQQIVQEFMKLFNYMDKSDMGSDEKYLLTLKQEVQRLRELL
jgi:hypothetical protein